MNNGNVKREELPKSALGGLSNGNAHVLDEAKQAVTHVASEVSEQAKDKVNVTLGAQKEKAASSIAGVADALREGGRSLREHDTAIPSEYADRAADQIDRIGSYLRNRTLGELVGDAESFARREPAIFFGGAFALGLLTARFLKSSGTHPMVDDRSASSGAKPGMDAYTNRNANAHTSPNAIAAKASTSAAAKTKSPAESATPAVPRPNDAKLGPSGASSGTPKGSSGGH